MILDTKAGLSVGFACILGTAVFGYAAFDKVNKLNYIQSHSPVLAAINEKGQYVSRGQRYTQAVVDFWRDSPDGPVRCTVRMIFPGSLADYRRPVKIFPREDSCDRPYWVSGPESPIPYTIIAASFALVGGLMLLFRILFR
jgi:hypothetical protein